MYGQDWTPLAAPGLARMRSPWEQGTTVSKMGDYIQVLPVETRAPLPSELGARMRPTLERSSATHGAHQESLRSKWSQNSRAGRSRSPRKRSQQLLKSEDPTLQRYTLAVVKVLRARSSPNSFNAEMADMQVAYDC